MLVDANIRRGTMEEGVVRSNDNGGLGVSDREKFSDNGERLFVFAANDGLALVNTFLCFRKSGISRSFDGQGQENESTTFSRESAIVNSSVT